MKEFISGNFNTAVTYNPWLMEAFKLVNPDRERCLLHQGPLFYADLLYKCNKEDELDKTLYQDELYDSEEEDEFDLEEENILLDYSEGEGYEYDYHRHK